jgi:hypothetical protein
LPQFARDLWGCRGSDFVKLEPHWNHGAQPQGCVKGQVLLRPAFYSVLGAVDPPLRRSWREPGPLLCIPRSPQGENTYAASRAQSRETWPLGELRERLIRRLLVVQMRVAALVAAYEPSEELGVVVTVDA